MHDSIAALVGREGWRAEGDAARVHYDGGGDRFAVEFYAGPERVLYWTVPAGDPSATAGNDPDATAGDDRNGTADNGDAPAATAAPVPREQIPDPLRRRIREDLDAAGVDPDAERRTV
ncbi:hypothetical protein [Halorubrum sp. SD626R]|uniref:DUF7538 family protein n=1 Tax=Halorubrum sp. SD626R TaxID=1419722 RepID=UPI000B884EF9|nr:hypothetical protein [Halorubrum sp. SD626R]TKX79970.1 hypothetical protein EXE53_13275 [Halorubrum sp. SD626R]